MIPVIDVFAGPGGLNEGFARVVGNAGGRAFDVAASFEMEPNAVKTLTLRSAVRELSPDHELYLPYVDFLDGRITLEQMFAERQMQMAWAAAERHVHGIELGPETRDASDEIIRKTLPSTDRWVLIGGPPCQAYSLVGRSRRAHDDSFSEDKKHFLYREYLHIIDYFRPAIFVMENVKGLLSAGHGGQNMFDLIRSDLQLGEAYEIRSLIVERADPSPSEFVIRSEEYGVPQRRHRVILLGVRSDLHSPKIATLERASAAATVRQAIGGMPRLRSRVTRTPTPDADWREAKLLGHAHASRFTQGLLQVDPNLRRNRTLHDWLRHPALTGLAQHEPRAHMKMDLARYAFLAEIAAYGARPNVTELPEQLQPNHGNINGGNTPFLDRFKVQTWDAPSSTVASHISKDGHYYIHPDAEQMRSLTVREAARLQTFPDDYYFWGNRTMQYHQVGNAVPPYLAYQIARIVAEMLDA